MGLSSSKAARARRRRSPPIVATSYFLMSTASLNTRSSREDGDHLPLTECLDNLVFIMQIRGSAVQPRPVINVEPWLLMVALLFALGESLGGTKLFGSATKRLIVTQKLHTGDRVDEILLWLREHRTKTSRWNKSILRLAVAIDDIDLLSMNPKLAPEHFVRTRDATRWAHASLRRGGPRQAPRAR